MSTCWYSIAGMPNIRELTQYADENGNEIHVSRKYSGNINVNFSGRGNTIRIADGANIGKLSVSFDGNNGQLEIGHNNKNGWLQFNVRIGENSTVVIGDNVSTTGVCTVSAVEGTTVRIGHDVMIASENQVRADDGHAIFDVYSGDRVNPSRDILIGDHVWLAFGACVLAGSAIGSGSVIGFRSVVTGKVPNNVVAVGVPARVTRKHIAWERPHLSLSEPAFKPHISVMEKSEQYWAETSEPVPQLSQAGLLRRIFRRR